MKPSAIGQSPSFDAVHHFSSHSQRQSLAERVRQVAITCLAVFSVVTFLLSGMLFLEGSFTLCFQVFAIGSVIHALERLVSPATDEKPDLFSSDMDMSASMSSMPTFQSKRVSLPDVRGGIQNEGLSCWCASMIQAILAVPGMRKAILSDEFYRAEKSRKTGISADSDSDDSEGSCATSTTVGSDPLGSLEGDTPNWGLARSILQNFLGSMIDGQVSTGIGELTKALKAFGAQHDPSDYLGELWETLPRRFRCEVDFKVMERPLGTDHTTSIKTQKGSYGIPLIPVSFPCNTKDGERSVQDLLIDDDPEKFESYFDDAKKEQMQPIRKEAILSKAVPMVVVSLKRTQAEMSESRQHISLKKDRRPIQINDFLNISIGGEEENPQQYKLVSMILHRGPDHCRSGHYTALVKDPKGRWLKYDDSCVSVYKNQGDALLNDKNVQKNITHFFYVRSDLITN